MGQSEVATISDKGVRIDHVVIDESIQPEVNGSDLLTDKTISLDSLSLDIHFLITLISIVSIIVAVLSTGIIAYSVVKEFHIEKRFNKYVEELPEKMMPNINKIVDDYVKNDLNQHAIDFLRENTISLLYEEQRKSIVLNDIYMSLFSSLVEHLDKNNHDVNEISNVIRKYTMDASYLILLFMKKKESIMRGLYYFSENPSEFVNDTILRNIESNYKTDFDIINAIKKVQNGHI